MAEIRTIITLGNRLYQKLAERGPIGPQIIERDLERFYYLLEKSLTEIDLNVNEACLIADALDGISFGPWAVEHLWLNIRDAIILEKLDTKWRVEGEALVEKLESLTPLQSLAIIDASERFWQKSRPEEDITEGVKKVFHLP